MHGPMNVKLALVIILSVVRNMAISLTRTLEPRYENLSHYDMMSCCGEVISSVFEIKCEIMEAGMFNSGLGS